MMLSKLLQLLVRATVVTESRLLSFINKLALFWLGSSGGFVCLFIKSTLHGALKKS